MIAPMLGPTPSFERRRERTSGRATVQSTREVDVARRTDLQLMIDELAGLDGSQATIRKLAGLLKWDAEKVRRVAEKGSSDPTLPVFIAKASVVKFRGSEIGSAVGIYADVAKVIINRFGPERMGYRDIDVVDSAKSGKRGSGVWTHPDLVMAAYPRRRSSADEPRRLHAIEVETADGFDLKSVYQAHAQGRGANYSWVFGSKRPGVSKGDWARVLWTANELKVGLVTFEKPHLMSTWTKHFDPVFRETTLEDRADFLKQTVSAANIELIGDW